VSTQAMAAEPDYTLAYNVGVTTDYRFRSIAQTSFKPAVQGGVDFSHKSGAYAGVWGSNVNWVKDFAGATEGSLEVDLYGGYKGELAKDLGFDVGLIAYLYPSNNAATNANTTEIYAALTYGVVTAKYSRSLGNFVANANSSGSQYMEIAATFDIGNGFSLTPHIGSQIIPNQSTSGDYTDYSLTLGKDFGNGISASLSAIGTNAKDGFYKTATVDNLGKSGLVASLKYSF
ncbi:MAG: hypothetical protein EBT05_10810, partial [Betaproteobacteria bacterium]|nr:hypothetical protein [Betaproteobacteria bacterium]